MQFAAPTTVPAKVLVLTPWSFRSGLIQAYTLPYLKMIASALGPGGRLDFVTFEQPGLEFSAEEGDAVRRSLDSVGISWRPVPYRRFGLAACLHAGLLLVRLTLACFRERPAAIHCFCTPSGGLGAVLSYLTGVPLVIDSYEPHADAMVEAGVWKQESAAFRILFFLERLQSHRAAAVIATAEGMRGYAASRYGASFAHFYTKPACVDLDLFRPSGLDTAALSRELGLEGKVVCVYAGKTGGIYLEREVFDLLKAAEDRWGDRFRAILLSADPPEKITSLRAASGLAESTVVHRHVRHEEVPRYLALADFGLTPVRPIPSKKLCAPIKDGEYWAMGLPVIITPGIADDSDLIERNGIGAVLRGFNSESYRDAIRTVAALLENSPRDALRKRIRKVASDHRSLDIARALYGDLYSPKGLTVEVPREA